mmetsp:Transcript_66323/g.181896  ORF Transcript_66323/g.181896 Transcript_66323/m.181896 type:complete len:126 (+) Transcript_66323:107-484(+)
MVGRGALSICRCLTILQMSDDELNLLRESMHSEGMDAKVTNADLEAKARLFWERQGVAPDKVLADAEAPAERRCEGSDRTSQLGFYRVRGTRATIARSRLLLRRCACGGRGGTRPPIRIAHGAVE